MINYYKFRVSVFRIDADSKSFAQVNDAEDASSVSLITSEIAFDGLFKIIKDNANGEWLAISEEDFNFTKEKILNKLK
jgi:indole-3-glycerol phosphate synthase